MFASYSMKASLTVTNPATLLCSDLKVSAFSSNNPDYTITELALTPLKQHNQKTIKDRRNHLWY